MTTELSNFTQITPENWVSPKYNNTEFDYHYVINTINLMEACGEKGFLCILYAVKTPEYLSADKLKKVSSSCGNEPNEVDILDICDYGLCAKIEDYQFDTVEQMETQIEKFNNELDIINMMFGFHMDKYQNRIGNTGWDFLDGNIGI